MKIFTKTYYALFIILGTLLLTELILSSFYDLPFSQSVADLGSSFGLIGASFGEILGWGMMGVFGAMAFRLAQKSCKALFKVLFIAFGAVVVGVSAFLVFSDLNSSHNGFKEISSLFVRILIAVVTESAIVGVSFFAIDIDDFKTLLVFWLVLMGAYYLGLAINFIVKAAVLRPRYRLIWNGYEGYGVGDLFEEWYRSGASSLAEKVFPYDVVHSDDFKSFPSGHSFVSMSAILVSYLPLLNKKAQSKNWVRYLLFSLMSIYGLTVAFSRIVYGAHYLSDTSIGGLLAVIPAFFVPWIAFRLLAKKGLLQEC